MGIVDGKKRWEWWRVRGGANGGGKGDIVMVEGKRRWEK